jgi:hypothetical protein
MSENMKEGFGRMLKDVGEMKEDGSISEYIK